MLYRKLVLLVFAAFLAAFFTSPGPAYSKRKKPKCVRWAKNKTCYKRCIKRKGGNCLRRARRKTCYRRCLKRQRAIQCTDGRINVAGHCCWPGQDWGAGSKKCLGKPECPKGMQAKGGACTSEPVCPSGRVLVAGHCCWPGQDWGVSSNRCIGRPKCPDGTILKDDNCVIGCFKGRILAGGHCCWSGQDWGMTQNKCLGTPKCPPGHILNANKQDCSRYLYEQACLKKRERCEKSGQEESKRYYRAYQKCMRSQWNCDTVRECHKRRYPSDCMRDRRKCIRHVRYYCNEKWYDKYKSVNRSYKRRCPASYQGCLKVGR